MGTKREEPLTTEEFAYTLAVIIHRWAERTRPEVVENFFISYGLTPTEARSILDEAYRRRLE